MSDKSDFSRKSVSFNVTDPIDKKILDHMESKPFTKYVKALILADIKSESNDETVIDEGDKKVKEEIAMNQATTNDILTAINNIADILQSKFIGDVDSDLKNKKEVDTSIENTSGVSNVDKFKNFENFTGV